MLIRVRYAIDGVGMVVVAWVGLGGQLGPAVAVVGSANKIQEIQ